MTYIHEWTNQILFHVNEKNIQMERKKPKRNLVTLTNEILITNDKY